MFWTWPDAPWQTNLWFIDDVNHFLNGEYNDVTWIKFGERWAMNGYRWFQLLNAQIFHFDTRIENLAYFVCAYVLCLSIGLSALGPKLAGTNGPARWIIFLIPPVIISLSGAGSRGMELGTFAGLVLIVLVFLFISSPRRKYFFEIVTCALLLVAAFVFLGGYIAGAALSLIVVLFVSSKKQRLSSRIRYQLFFAAITTCLISVGHAIMTLISGNLDPEDLTGTTSENLLQDPLFPIKYFFWGATNSIMSTNTKDILGEVTWMLVITGIVVSCTTVFALAGKVVFDPKFSAAPYLLIFYGAGTALMLLVFRHSSSEYLLSPWYSLHFKVALSGVLWLLALRVTDTSKRGRIYGYGAPLAGTLILILVLVANYFQIARGNSERAYFQNIGFVALIPTSLEVAEGKLNTQLELPLADSLNAIEVLRKHKLSVYNDPVGFLRDLWGYEPVAVTQPGLPIDGWAGPRLNIRPISAICNEIEVTVLKNDALPNQVVEIRDDEDTSQIFEVKKDFTFSFAARNENQSLHLSFRQTWVPSETSNSTDSRELANRIVIACSRDSK
jgi:hypothetical protein